MLIEEDEVVAEYVVKQSRFDDLKREPRIQKQKFGLRVSAL